MSDSTSSTIKRRLQKEPNETKRLSQVLESPTSSAPLVDWDALPPWQRDNHYILTSYRPASASYAASLASLTYLHNESVNIWSHLLGALFFAFLWPLFLLYHSSSPASHGEESTLTTTASTFLSSTRAKLTPANTLVFSIFFLSAITCLGISATYHAVSNHSQEVARTWNKLDYVGIVVLIWGSFVPSLYFGFGCDRDRGLRGAYWGMISFLALLCALISTLSSFRTPTWRPFRAAMFAAMGLSAILPVFHGLYLYGLERMVSLIGLPWLVGQGGLYLLGAGLYAARFPERLQPGKFDVYGSSHQIFHVLIVLAAGAHFVGLVRAWEFARGEAGEGRCVL